MQVYNKTMDTNIRYRKALKKTELDRYLKEIQPLRKGFDLLVDHVVVTDENANILYANKAAQKNTGFSAQEIIGKNPGDLWGGNMPQDFYKTMWQTIKVGKKPFVGEVQNRKKDGTIYWQEVHITPVLDKKNQVRFFIGIEPDITDRKGREKFREEFLSMLGHQARNPTSAIGWALELLLSKKGLTKAQYDILREAYKENRRLADLMEDLLILSRVGSVEVKKERFDLAREIEVIIEDVKRRNSKVEFVFARPKEDCILFCNKMLASQVFTNIITNAAEYSNQISGKVSTELTQEEGYAWFSCENNGAIIPVEEQSKVFSKFFRAANAKTYKETGTGLGLFIVKMICESFGWSISFRSPATSGEGTVFVVEMPKEIG